MINRSAFGRQLQGIRTTRGMTQEQLAEKSGLSAHYIGNLEQGVRTPSSISLMKLCHALGTTPDALLKDSISDEMLKGLSVNISETTTLREAWDVFRNLLSDYLGFDDEPTASSDNVSAQYSSTDSGIPDIALSDLLLRMSEENPDTL